MSLLKMICTFLRAMLSNQVQLAAENLALRQRPRLSAADGVFGMDSPENAHECGELPGSIEVQVPDAAGDIRVIEVG